MARTFAMGGDEPVLLEEGNSSLSIQNAAKTFGRADCAAGQRCSALRLLCVQEEMVEEVLAMLGGAMQELTIGPAVDYATDVPPVIDAEAQATLLAQITRLAQGGARLLMRTAWPAEMQAMAM